MPIGWRICRVSKTSLCRPDASGDHPWYTAPLSRYADEAEILLPRGSEFEVVSREPGDDGSVSTDNATSAAEVAAAIRADTRVGQGMYVPYARKWEVGGCSPIHSLRTFPYDGVQVLSEGIVGLGRTVRLTDNGLVVEGQGIAVWVAVNRSIRGEGPPDAYLLGIAGEPRARYAGDSPEVIIALLQGLSLPAPSIPSSPELRIGFPALQTDHGVTYVGSWQWGINGEARDDEFVARAAVATLAAINGKSEHDAG